MIKFLSYYSSNHGSSVKQNILQLQNSNQKGFKAIYRINKYEKRLLTETEQTIRFKLAIISKEPAVTTFTARGSLTYYIIW